jgi:hypothetical protein
MEDVKWSHCYGWPTQKTHVKSGLIIMGDLPKWKMMVSLWWVTYPSERWKMKGGSHYNGRPTQRKTDEKRSHYNGWPTQMIECDLTGKKKRLGWSSPDRIRLTNLALSGCRLTWKLLLMMGLISSFLWDSPTGRVHLILFSFQDQNRFFVIINAMLPSFSPILLDFIEDLSVTNHKYVQCFKVRWHACILTWCEI